MSERENIKMIKGMNSDNSKEGKRKDIQNKVSEWIQEQNKRELKNESELSRKEKKKSKASYRKENVIR